MKASSQRVASLFLARSGCPSISGGQRNEYLDRVWAMYAKTYASIGLHIPHSQGLLKYQVWELCFDKGEPVQFALYKKTGFGLKRGLSGHDGSSEGKSKQVANLRTKFKQTGYYGEVSHKVKGIVVSSGAPAVCAVYVDDVLRKPIKAVGELEYQRNLKGVGAVTKMMVGRPKGVPTVNPKRPSCPVGTPEEVKLAMDEDEDDFCEVDAHYACLSCDLD